MVALRLNTDAVFAVLNCAASQTDRLLIAIAVRFRIELIFLHLESGKGLPILCAIQLQLLYLPEILVQVFSLRPRETELLIGSAEDTLLLGKLRLLRRRLPLCLRLLRLSSLSGIFLSFLHAKREVQRLRIALGMEIELIIPRLSEQSRLQRNALLLRIRLIVIISALPADRFRVERPRPAPIRAHKLHPAQILKEVPVAAVSRAGLAF